MVTYGVISIILGNSHMWMAPVMLVMFWGWTLCLNCGYPHKSPLKSLWFIIINSPLIYANLGGLWLESMALWANPWWCFLMANDGRWWMIPSSFCFWWVNGAVASVYTIHEPFEHCLLQLGFWNILLVCPLFPFNSTLILQNLQKTALAEPLVILCLCFEVFRLHLSSNMAGDSQLHGWIRVISIAALDQNGRLPGRQAHSAESHYPFFESDIHELCEDFPTCHGTNRGCSDL